MKLDKWHVNESNFTHDSIMDRFYFLDNSIQKYFEDNSVENLHKVRIYLRRLRFTMEVFSVYFKENENYKNFYKKVSKLQDTTGKARDLDVIQEYAVQKGIDDSIVKEDKEVLYSEVRGKIEKFFNSKSYEKFKKITDYKEFQIEKFLNY
jgi:CHAD domain-containing protein